LFVQTVQDVERSGDVNRSDVPVYVDNSRHTSPSIPARIASAVYGGVTL